jgi:hypothetical protein
MNPDPVLGPVFHRLAVGSPYLDGPRRLPSVVQYNYRGGTHELVLCLDRPSAAEVEGVRTGTAGFALWIDLPLILLCYRFDPGLPWSDTPFSFHRLKRSRPDEAVLPPEDRAHTEESRALLHVILIGAHDGIIRALRVCSFSPPFTRYFHAAIRSQARAPFEPTVEDAKQDALYRRFPRTEAVVKGCLFSCEGGD